MPVHAIQGFSCRRQPPETWELPRVSQRGKHPFEVGASSLGFTRNYPRRLLVLRSRGPLFSLTSQLQGQLPQTRSPAQADRAPPRAHAAGRCPLPEEICKSLQPSPLENQTSPCGPWPRPHTCPSPVARSNPPWCFQRQLKGGCSQSIRFQPLKVEELDRCWGQVDRYTRYTPTLQGRDQGRRERWEQVEEAGKPLAFLSSSAQNRSDPGLRGLWVLSVA